MWCRFEAIVSAVSARARNWMIMAVSLIAIAVFRMFSAQPVAPSAYFDYRTPMLIANQGGVGNQPGNTLQAMQHAVQLGVDVLSVDVRSSADGELVLFHDEVVDHTTDGTGPVSALTYARLRDLDAAYHWPLGGESKPWRGKGVHVPRLAEALAAFPSLRFSIDVQEDDPQIASKLCVLIRGHHALTRVLVGAASNDTLQAFRRACPEVATRTSHSELLAFVTLQKLGMRGLFVPSAASMRVPREYYGVTVLDEQLVADATALGIAIEAPTTNESEDLAWLLRVGVAGIITDYPDRLLQVIAERERR